MAVVFAFLIKNTNYVSTKNTTNSSVNYSKNNKRYCHVYILLLPVSWLFSLTWEPFWFTVSKPFSFRRVNISLGLIGIFCISFPYHGYIISRIFYVYQYFSVILRILFFLICLITWFTYVLRIPTSNVNSNT